MNLYRKYSEISPNSYLHRKCELCGDLIDLKLDTRFISGISMPRATPRQFLLLHLLVGGGGASMGTTHFNLTPIKDF